MLACVLVVFQLYRDDDDMNVYVDASSCCLDYDEIVNSNWSCAADDDVDDDAVDDSKKKSCDLKGFCGEDLAPVRTVGARHTLVVV